MITREKYIARAEKLLQDGVIDKEKFNTMMNQIDDFTEPIINIVDLVKDLVKFIEITDPYGFDDYFEGMSNSEIIDEYIEYLGAYDSEKIEEIIGKIEDIIKEAGGDEDIILDGYALIRDLKIVKNQG